MRYPRVTWPTNVTPPSVERSIHISLEPSLYSDLLRQRRSEYSDGSKEIWIERSTDGGVTFVGHVTLGYRINPMPGKMVQASTGRIFICTASNNGTGDGDEGAKIFFSD